MAATRFAPRLGAGLLLLAAVLGTGCASLPAVEQQPQHYSGRFAASISRGDARDAASGRFTLAAGPTRSVLDLASPLGNTLARVEAGAEGATLTAPQGDGTLATWHGPSADALAESVLGYALPVTGLPDWLQGRAAAGRPALLSPETGPAERIEQDGWVIAVEERFDDSGLPRRLTLDRADAAGLLRLRLVLDAPAAGPRKDGR
jgi:outer membrane lipoprotein LolB